MLKIINIVFFTALLSCNHTPKVVDTTNKALKFENGVMSYFDEPFSGVLNTVNKNGSIQYYSEYTLGRKNGIERKYFPEGVLAEERFYTKGRKSGIHKAWWKKDHLKFVYHFNDNGLYHGNLKEWFNSGQLRKDFNYKNGKETGAQKFWSSSGKIRANYVVKKGERFGLIGLKKCKSLVNSK